MTDSLLPKVSIAIPTYNRKDMLKRAIDSVLRQDYNNLEIIVSDNASEDGTDTLMKEYQSDPRIIYLKNSTNIGPVKNGQQAYLKATGKYFIVLCDDDYFVSPRFFSKAVKAMEENTNIAFTYAICTINHSITNTIEIPPICAKAFINGLEFFQNYEQKGYPRVIVFFGLSRKEFIDESQCLMWDTFGHDRWLWRTLPLYGDVYFIQDEIIGTYTIHDQGNDVYNPSYFDSSLSIVESVNRVLDIAKTKFPEQKFANSDKEAALVILFFARAYRQKNGAKKLLIDLWNHELRKKHPKVFYYIVKRYIQRLIQIILRIRKWKN